MAHKLDKLYGYLMRNFTCKVRYQAEALTDLETAKDFKAALESGLMQGHLITDTDEYITIFMEINETTQSTLLAHFEITMSHVDNKARNVLWTVERALNDGFTSMRVTNDGRYDRNN
jgi:hypothetical protein